MRPLRNWKIFLSIVFAFTFASCSPQVESEVIGGRGSPDGNDPSGTDSDGNPSKPAKNEKGTKEGEEFFSGKIVAAFKASSENCLNCHNAPREILNQSNPSDEAIYDYGKMFALLKKGNFSNDNGFISPMLGRPMKNGETHPGTVICRNEEAPLCALAIEWYQIEFANAVSSLGLMEKIEVSGPSQHDIVGFAKDVNDPDEVLSVTAYIDGPKETGTPITVQPALAENSYGADIGKHGFRIKITDEMLNNREREVYVYALQKGEEVLLGGSPKRFVSYKQNDKFPGLASLGINFGAGCNCHTSAFTYDELWPDLATPIEGSNAPLSPTNNKGYDMSQTTPGSRGANHPNVSSPSNAAGYIAWWCAEFNIDNDVAECN